MKKKHLKRMNDFRFNLILILSFFTGLLCVFVGYAWLSSTMNVDISIFNISANDEAGLTFSLNGIDWTNDLVISKSSIITDLTASYPSHNNQWSEELTTVSTTGIISSNQNRFDLYDSDSGHYWNDGRTAYYTVNTSKIYEDVPTSSAKFIAFDLYFKNVTGSPYPDNLYLTSETYFLDDNSASENYAVDAIRFGMIWMDTVKSSSDVNTIQNIRCNGNCTSVIYEPNAGVHNSVAKYNAEAYGITLNDGEYYPTYAVKVAKNGLNMWTGVHGSGFTYDETSFDYQVTLRDLSEPLHTINDGITKTRVYIWIEGQDIDVLAQASHGYTIKIKLDFKKDNAGYEHN